MEVGLMSRSATPRDFETLNAGCFSPVCPNNGISSTEIHLPFLSTGSIIVAAV